MQLPKVAAAADKEAQRLDWLPFACIAECGSVIARERHVFATITDRRSAIGSAAGPDGRRSLA